MPELSEERIYLDTPYADPNGYPVDPDTLALESDLRAKLEEVGVDPASKQGRALLDLYVGEAVRDQYYELLDSTM